MSSESDHAMDVAKFRFGVIAEFVTRQKFDYGEKERLLAEKSLQTYSIPGSDKTHVSRATMLAWIKAYKTGGYKIEALSPKKRTDIQSFRSLSTQVKMEVIRLKRENPYFTVPILIKKLRHANVIKPDEIINKPTLYRFIKIACQDVSPDNGVDRRRFEAENPNDIWQCDFLHGPMVQVDGFPTVKKTYLMAILDDHSRLITHAKFYLSENFATLSLALKDAIQRRGIPQKFYVDNGSCYRTDDLERILACLGIALQHSRPYTPQGRGKVERWFKNIRDSFLPMLPSEVITLDDLNQRLEAFVNEYHETTHSSLGSTPLSRYQDKLTCVRHAPPDLIDYFRLQESRKVKKDRTIQINRKIFEVSPKLIDQTVSLLFHEDSPDDIEVKFENLSYGKAIPVDLAINARGGRDWGKDKFEKPAEPHPKLFPTITPSPLAGGQLFNSHYVAESRSPE